MVSPDSSTPDSSANEAKLSRRSIAKGVAWAAPAMVLASQAPALASSTDPDKNLSINGWVYMNWDQVRTNSYGCIESGTLRVTSPEATRYYPNSENDNGLWVDDATEETRIENAKLTLWVKDDDVQTHPLEWFPYERYGRNYGWSKPTYVGRKTDRQGRSFALYEMRFTGETRLVGSRLYLVGNIGWYAPFQNRSSYTCATDIMNCMERDVDVTYKRGGKQQHRNFKRCVTFRRGLLPSSDKLPRRRGRSVLPPADYGYHC
ncbi:hypothetical protein ACUH9H_02020 [Dermabacteraceae bacterium P13128]